MNKELGLLLSKISYHVATCRCNIFSIICDSSEDKSIENECLEVNENLYSISKIIDCILKELSLKENPCNFCGTPDLEEPNKKCLRSSICTNHEKE